MSEEATVSALIAECNRQEESCSYTATALYIWQKRARLWKIIFIIAPVIFGGIASSQILGFMDSESGKFVGLFFGLLAGFFPAIYAGLDLNLKVTEIGKSASDFTSLRDRFRQAANVTSQAPISEFQTAFEGLMDRMDATRSSAPPSPEWCFRKAQAKIKRGDYDFDSDLKAETESRLALQSSARGSQLQGE